MVSEDGGVVGFNKRSAPAGPGKETLGAGPIRLGEDNEDDQDDQS